MRQSLGDQQQQPIFQVPLVSLKTPKIGTPAHILAHTFSALNLKLSTGQNTFKAGTPFRTVCELLDLKTSAAENAEPHFEVAPSPFERGAYIARLSRNGVSVFEKVPQEIMADDTDCDTSLFWPTVRKRLARRLSRIESFTT